LVAGASSGLPILLVEDSQANQAVAVAILSKAGYRVETAENGLKAVAAVKREPFALILMDVAMPEMDGLEATGVIRSLPGAEAQTPIIAMTASAFSEDRQRCLSAGMDDFLTKPIVRDELLEVVGRVFAGQERRPRLTEAVHEPLPTAEPTERKDKADDRESTADSESLLDESILSTLEQHVGAEALSRMVEAFVAEAQGRLSAIEAAIGRADHPALAAAAHALKGSAGTFGARALQADALALELAAKAGQSEGLAEAVSALLVTAGKSIDRIAQRCDGRPQERGMLDG
jgi:CheY-like chemotaxis protein